MNIASIKYPAIFCLVLSALAFTPASAEQKSPPVQLAQVFDQENVKAYLVSQKYDGVRAIWKDGELRTRTGHLIHTPAWFTQELPDIWLDGELWSEHGQFESILSTVSKQQPVDTQWRKIKYMVFDAPNYHQTFAERAEFYTSVINSAKLAHIKPVAQFSVKSNAELDVLLARYTKNGAEGLMLQKADALFTDGRSDNLLKLKPYMDAEAKVIKHLRGKGKYKNSMGALVVQYEHADGRTVEFKIGTGFTDEQRENPPPIGSQITFKYHGYTKNGIPRFASFLRVREPTSR